MMMLIMTVQPVRRYMGMGTTTIQTSTSPTTEEYQWWWWVSWCMFLCTKREQVVSWDGFVGFSSILSSIISLCNEWDVMWCSRWVWMLCGGLGWLTKWRLNNLLDCLPYTIPFLFFFFLSFFLFFPFFHSLHCSLAYLLSGYSKCWAYLSEWKNKNFSMCNITCSDTRQYIKNDGEK